MSLLWAVVVVVVAVVVVLTVCAPCHRPRYFIVAIAMVLIHWPFHRALGAAAAAGTHLLVSGAALALFVLKPFTWVDGTVGRYVW